MAKATVETGVYRIDVYNKDNEKIFTQNYADRVAVAMLIDDISRGYLDQQTNEIILGRFGLGRKRTPADFPFTVKLDDEPYMTIHKNIHERY